MNVLQRRSPRAQPMQLGEVFVLNRNGASAQCVLRIHPLGWELRLKAGALLLSHVCRSHFEVQATVEQWKAQKCSGMGGTDRTPAPIL